MGLVNRTGHQRLQFPAAAMEFALRRGGDDIAAVRAQIHIQFFQIADLQIVGGQVASQQAFGADPEYSGQRRQQADIRTAQTALPFADGLSADVQRLRQLPLGQAPFFPQAGKQPAGFLCIHTAHLPYRIAKRWRKGKQRSVDKVPPRQRAGAA